MTFIIGFATAPYWIYRELEDRNSALEKRLFDRERRQEAVSRLWQLRERGVKLRNLGVIPPDEDKWLAEYDAWHEQVLDEAGVVSQNLQSWLRTLDHLSRGPRLATPAVSPEHALKRSIVSEILVRLEEFLKAEMLKKDIG